MQLLLIDLQTYIVLKNNKLPTERPQKSRHLSQNSGPKSTINKN
jgi:hypothetical protein